MGRPSKYSPELRRRAVAEVIERDRRIAEVARDLGMSSETLRNWVNQARIDAGTAPGTTTEDQQEIARLRKEVADQQRTIEILKAATTYFRKGGRPEISVMTAFIDVHRIAGAHGAGWPVATMCRTIGLAERTYHAARARPASERSISDADHTAAITTTFAANYSCYGARRVHHQLRRDGRDIARCTVERLMRTAGIRGVQRGSGVRTTIPDDTAPRAPDLVDRQFVADRPGQLWLADITYVATGEGWLYVAFVLDVFSRMIVGWQIAGHMRTDLVLDALEMASWRRDRTTGPLVHHSDAGSQYTSIRYTDRLAELASSPRSARSAIHTTTRWRRRSTAPTRRS